MKMVRTGEDFRSHPSSGSLSGCHVSPYITSSSEVADLDFESLIDEEEVGWFEISMDKFKTVKISNTITGLMTPRESVC